MVGQLYEIVLGGKLRRNLPTFKSITTAVQLCAPTCHTYLSSTSDQFLQLLQIGIQLADPAILFLVGGYLESSPLWCSVLQASDGAVLVVESHTEMAPSLSQPAEKAHWSLHVNTQQQVNTHFSSSIPAVNIAGRRTE